MKKTSVLLADDHTLIRAGLRMVVDAQPATNPLRLHERTDAAPCHHTELPRLVTSEAHLLALAGGSGFAARIHARMR